jgi:hypothetical protein
MPLYTYLNLTTGKHEVHQRPIAERDTLRGCERLFEPPSAVKVVNPSAGGRMTLQAQQVMDGYKRLEEKGQLRKSRGEASQIKDTWRDATEDSEQTDEKTANQEA